ncbi:MAG: ECF-type sigma factor [Acidobacteriota bacterium]
MEDCAPFTPKRPAEADDPQSDVSRLLAAWNEGQGDAPDRLAEAIYPELRRLACFHLANWSGDVSLQATELVHEIYFKLLGQTRASWHNRAQFFAVLSRLMRRLLVDRARYRARQKRGGAAPDLTLEDSMVSFDGRDIDLIALDEALDELTRIDTQAVEVVEALFFAGQTHDEASTALGLGRTTVGRKWRFARAWLRKRLAL